MCKENLLTKFTNEEFGELRVLTIDEEPMFVGKELVEKLGYDISGTTSYSKYIKKYCDEEDFMKMNNSNLELFGISDLGRKGGYLVNESGMYSLILGSDLPSAKNFKRWVTKEVLPSIRKHGAYIGENADENYVNNELRFGNKTTIKTFANSDPAVVNKLYSEFKEYIDTEYKNNTDVRKSRYSSVEKGLTRLLENVSTNVDNIGLCYNVQKLRYEVLSDIKILGNRISGGKRAGLTRKNNKLNKEINSLKSDIEALKPISFDEMVRVDNYAISKNDLNDSCIDSMTGKPKICSTREYKGWKYYFKKAMDEANIRKLFSHIDWNKPVEISYAVTCHEKNDIGNFIDALQDVVQDYFHCDDKKFLVGTQLIVGIEPDKMKRKTWLYFRNVEEDNLYVKNGVDA